MVLLPASAEDTSIKWFPFGKSKLLCIMLRISKLVSLTFGFCLTFSYIAVRGHWGRGFTISDHGYWCIDSLRTFKANIIYKHIIISHVPIKLSFVNSMYPPLQVNIVYKCGCSVYYTYLLLLALIILCFVLNNSEFYAFIHIMCFRLLKCFQMNSTIDYIYVRVHVWQTYVFLLFNRFWGHCEPQYKVDPGTGMDINPALSNCSLGSRGYWGIWQKWRTKEGTPCICECKLVDYKQCIYVATIGTR